MRVGSCIPCLLLLLSFHTCIIFVVFVKHAFCKRNAFSVKIAFRFCVGMNSSFWWWMSTWQWNSILVIHIVLRWCWLLFHAYGINSGKFVVFFPSNRQQRKHTICAMPFIHTNHDSHVETMMRVFDPLQWVSMLSEHRPPSILRSQKFWFGLR